MKRTAIYDANVLYPASLRSFLMWIGHHGLVHARWTDRILDECFDNLLQSRPDLSPDRIARTRKLMCEAIPDCLVTGFESHIESLDLPDPDDRHILAAAIKAKAQTIVTLNLKDFPEDGLATYGVKAKHPDDFVLELLDEAPNTVLRCVEDEASIRDNPPHSARDVAQILIDRGLERSGRKILARLPSE